MSEERPDYLTTRGPGDVRPDIINPNIPPAHWSAGAWTHVHGGHRWPRATIIIPTKDRDDLLAGILADLARYTFLAEWQVVVVNTGSTPCEWAVDRYGVQLINAPGASFAWANNAGAEAARGDHLILLNNDLRLESGLHGQLLQEAGRIGMPRIIGVRLVYPNHLIQHAGIGFDLDGNPYHLWREAPAEHPEALRPRYLSAVTFAAALVPTQVWRDLGGLDEQFVNAYDDVDFCLRAREIGCQVYYAGDLVATHLAEQSPGRHDHDAESWQRFQDRWLVTGRLNYNLGFWPFQVQR